MQITYAERTLYRSNLREAERLDAAMMRSGAAFPSLKTHAGTVVRQRVR